MSSAIIVLVQILALRVVAEGVETLAQLALLRELSCKLLQGYPRSVPLAPEDFIAEMTELDGSSDRA